MSRKPLIDESGEVRELLEEDFATMRHRDEMPIDTVGMLPTKRRPGQRGPAKKPAKHMVTLRMKPSVLEAYRATGPGWQIRMTEVLEREMPASPETQSPSR